MNKRTDKNTAKKYLKEVNYWEVDKNKSLKRSNRVAWGLAVFGLGMAAVSAWSIGQLVPLKTVEPYVIRVNETSGTVDIVTALKEGKQTYEEALNKYFLNKYVRYREGYSRTLAEEYYYNTGLMSGDLERKRYFSDFNPKNPDSPLNIYGANDTVKVEIQSTSFIGGKGDVALVRYIKKVQLESATKPFITHWAATLKFRYSAAPTLERDREITPLGFQVTEYRNDPDSFGTESAPIITYKTAKKQPKKIIDAGIFPQPRKGNE